MGDIDRITRKLARIPQAVKDAVKPALETSGGELVDAMASIAPQDTGALKGSIVMTPGEQATPPYSPPGGSTVVPENAVMVTAGNKDVRYPHLVEYGTAAAPAQPFFWPAYRLMKKRITNRVRRAIGKAVREAWQ